MRFALAQLNYKIGDFENNYRKIEAVVREKAALCDVIVFSELCLSGYYPKDLITHPGFFEQQQEILKKIQALSCQYAVDLVVGLITSHAALGKAFHNSLVWIHLGEIVYTYHKRLLPVYNIFNEARHFAPGEAVGRWTIRDHRVGFLICEDAWAIASDYPHPCDPVCDLIASGPLDMIICLNASPSNVGKESLRLKRFGDIAKQIHAPILFINQIGGHDDIVFDGSSFVLNAQGELVGCLPAFEESVGLVSWRSGTWEVLPPIVKRPPLSQAALFYRQTILGLRDYVQKCGFESIVVGVSGGIDSAITLALAVQALGATHVTAMAMPSRYSSADSLEDATALCKALKVQLVIFSIEEEFTLALERFQSVYQEVPRSLTEQNIQARLRGRLLMEFSNQTGALVLSTGNKSELSVGYTTLYGDMTGGLNLIGDLYKTDVYELAQYYNQQHPDAFIPTRIFTKAPSAELAPHQKDSDNLPEYAILDPILRLYIEGDLLSTDERQACEKIVNKQSSKVVASVHHMVDRAEFKRRQSAPIIRVQRRAFGYGRQFPIAAVYGKYIH